MLQLAEPRPKLTYFKYCEFTSLLQPTLRSIITHCYLNNCLYCRNCYMDITETEARVKVRLGQQVVVTNHSVITYNLYKNSG